MKKILFIMAVMLGLGTAGVAQNGGGKNDGGRIAALKIAYLTKKLNLSTEEAQKFWPIYNKYTEEIRQVRIEQRQKKMPEIEVEDKLLNIRKKYNGEFVKALSPDKVNTFFRSEKEFGIFLQKEMMERRQQRLDNRRRNN